jgi:hypothetical protein
MQVFCTITAKNNGERVAIQVSEDATPTSLRQQASSATKIPLDQLRLIFRGRMVKDDASKNAVEEYKLESDCVLHCMGKPNETESSPSSHNGITPTTVAVAAPNTATSAPVNAASATPITERSAALIASAIMRLRQNNPPSVYQMALVTLDKILNNIVSHPMEEKYRQVKRQNPAFSKRLGGLVGGHDCMLAVGFHVERDGSNEIYQLPASANHWFKIVQAKAQVETAAELAKEQQQRQMTHSTTTPVSNTRNNNNSNPLGATTAGGIPGLTPPSGGPMPTLDPQIQSSLYQIMSNPEAFRSLLQVRSKNEIDETFWVDPNNKWKKAYGCYVFLTDKMLRF